MHSGELIDHCFKDSDAHPKGKEKMPKHNACEPPKLHDMPANELKEQMKLAEISAKGNAYDLRKSCKNETTPSPTKRKHSKL